MNLKRYLSASVAVFIFIYLFEWVFHGMGLKGIYQETAHIWRPEESMGQYMIWMMLGQALFSFGFVYLFIPGYKGGGIAEGVRYGIYLSILFIAGHFIWYAVLPLPMNLIIAWDIGAIIELGLAGALAALIYKN